ncbi:MAG: hypothetical protein ACJA0H_001248, partial [Francisellaceae bacterium]
KIFTTGFLATISHWQAILTFEIAYVGQRQT